MLHNVLSAHCKQPRQLTASRRDPGEGSLPSVPAPPLAFAPFSLKTATAVHYNILTTTVRVWPQKRAPPCPASARR